MRHSMIPALAVAFTLTTAASLACDGAKSAAAGAKMKDCCAAKAGTIAAKKDCGAAKKDCGGAKAGTIAAKKAGTDAGCPHARKAALRASRTADAEAIPVKTVAAVHHADSSGCPLAHARRAAAHGCKSSKAKVEGATAFLGSGQILCAKCDLAMSDTCRSMFRAAGAEKTFALCDGVMSDNIRKLTKHGELDVTVHGRTTVSDSGETVLCLEGFSVGTI